MGSLALVPVGYLLAGPLAELRRRRAVLGVGSVIGARADGAALLRSTRELRNGAPAQSEPEVGPTPRELVVTARGSA